MNTPITPVYAAILGLALAALGIRTIMLARGQADGEGDRLEHQKAMQAFNNLTEYAPMAMLLMWFLEQRSESALLIHIFCILFLLGRIVHAVGVSQVNETYAFRIVGMALTFVVIIAVSVRLLPG